MLRKLSGIQNNISLAKYTTFKIGGIARYFYVAKSDRDIIKAVRAARKYRLPFFVLGGGSNLLVADEGYDGLVIKIQNPNSKFQIKSKIQNPKICVEAGMPLSLVVSEATKNSLTGLEWAVGIPGTVGGAIRGNAGAFGGSMADVIKSVKVLQIANCKLQIANFKNKDCKFGYRDSIFKHANSATSLRSGMRMRPCEYPNLIILSAVLQLKKGNRKEIRNKIKEILQKRDKTQPLNFPSSGSIFKNTKKFPAGYLIEKCGLKGKKIGSAQISKKHANFIVNLGGAKAEDVKKLIDLIKRKVENKFKITLKEEIEFLGFSQK